MNKKSLDEITSSGKKSEYRKMRDLTDTIITDVFKNTVGVTYAYTDDHRLLNVQSDDLKRYAACEYEDCYGTQPKDTTIKQIVMNLQGRARNTPIRETYIRVGAYKGDWYYDLADGHAVKINKGSWEITVTPPIFPTDVRTQKQVHPKKTKDPLKSIHKLISFLNLSDDDSKNLFIFMLISCFIPNIKHPLVMVEGPMGSAKSTFAEIMQLIVSPSGFGHIGHDKVMDIALQFSNRYFRSLDNVSEIGNNFSDMLCKAATGGEYTKRTAYTNTDETSLVLHKGVTFINGIGIAGRPDMNERSIILRLKTLHNQMRISTNHLFEQVLAIAPEVLGAIFTVLSEIRDMEEHRITQDNHRMSDFTSWSRLVSFVLFDSQQHFIQSMNLNIDQVKRSTEDSNAFLGYVIEQMAVLYEVEGSMSFVYKTLMQDFFDQGGTQYNIPEGFPTHYNKLRSCLARVESLLNDNDIFFEDAGYRKFKIYLTDGVREDV